MKEKRKVTLIGTGFVGMSMAYSLMNTGGIDELILIDQDEMKAQGEAMDLNDGLPYTFHKMKIKAGSYKDCKDSDIIVICAGANQKEGQTRLDLVKINTHIMQEIAMNIKKSGFDGIVIVASNPVDILSYTVYKILGSSPQKVIGTGTLLDSARMRYLLSEYLNVSSNNISAYMLGEHGDSTFISWLNTYVGCKSIIEYIEENDLDMHDLNDIYLDVRDAAYKIIERKRATYYGIGVALNKLIQTIFNDSHEILCVSAYLNSKYKKNDIFMGVPCIIGRNGIEDIIELQLNEVDEAKFAKSYSVLRNIKREVKKDLGLV